MQGVTTSYQKTRADSSKCLLMIFIRKLEQVSWHSHIPLIFATVKAKAKKNLTLWLIFGKQQQYAVKWSTPIL